MKTASKTKATGSTLSASGWRATATTPPFVRRRTRPGQPAPILVLNHGGWDGIEAEWAFELVDDCLADFFVVVPSFRGEELRIFDDTYESTGEQSLINRDIIDVMALISGVVDNYPGAQDDDVSAWGYSRGGGVSLMLGIRDPRVDRVVNVFGPTDVLTYPDMINGVIGHLRGEVGPTTVFPGPSSRPTTTARRVRRAARSCWAALRCTLPTCCPSGFRPTMARATPSFRSAMHGRWTGRSSPGQT